MNAVTDRFGDRFGPLNPGQEAAVEQWVTGAATIDKEWPYNQGLLSDERLSRLVIERLQDAYAAEFMSGGRSYLVFPQGLVVEVAPDRDAIAATARAHQPGAQSSCDSCGNYGIAGLAVVAVPRNLVGVVLCAHCTASLKPDHLITIDTEGIES